MEQIPKIIQALLLDNILKTNDAISVCGPDDTILFSNQSYLSLLGSKHLQINGKLWEDCIRKSFKDKKGLNFNTTNIDKWLAVAHSNRRKDENRTFEIDTCDGRWYLCNEITDSQGYIIFHGTENTHNKKLELALQKTSIELKHLASTDSLTGLYNRRYFFLRLKNEISRFQRDATYLSVLMLDIDYFKKVNDQYGHSTGDAVLVKVSDILKKMIRPYDVATRMGGEEFSIILPNTNRQGGEVIAERIRAAIEAISFDYIVKGLKITISIGGMTSNTETDANNFTLNSDYALYKSKDKGRNQVVWFN